MSTSRKLFLKNISSIHDFEEKTNEKIVNIFYFLS